MVQSPTDFLIFITTMTMMMVIMMMMVMIVIKILSIREPVALLACTS